MADCAALEKLEDVIADLGAQPYAPRLGLLRQEALMPADFSVSYHGTITLLHPLTAACREWIDDNVHVEGWQWFGNNGFAVEPRYLDYLVGVLGEHGFYPKEED
jgi:hypothetical protein